jgi:F-type H+-transporting ATPase subunit b
MNELIHHLVGDTHFWVAVSTVICFAFIISKVRAPLLQTLDRRTDSIRARLDEAEDLYHEAQRIMADYQAKQNQVEAEAALVIKAAEQRAQAMIAQAQADIQKAIIRQEASARLRIERAERDVVEAIRETVVKAALERVQTTLDKQNDTSAVDASLAAFSKTLH